MRFDREKMLDDMDRAMAPPMPPQPYEVTALEMAKRWDCGRDAAVRKLRANEVGEDNPDGIYLSRIAKRGKNMVEVWWEPRWKEAWEQSQLEDLT